MSTRRPEALPSEARAALRVLHDGDAASCIRELEALAQRMPEHAALHNALGSVLAAQGLLERARESLRRALACCPEYTEATTNLGNVQLELGELEAAQALLEHATTDASATAQAFVGLGRTRLLLGHYPAARAAFARAPRQPGAHAGTWSQRCYATLLDPELDAREVVAIHRASASELTPRSQPTASGHAALDARRLRLGYVSADFREHSVPSFLEGVLANHDRRSVELFLYSDTPREDDTSARLYSWADHVVRSRGLSHPALAARCQHDQLDVLIDLAGHTQANRQPMFFLAPATVSLGYLGYPGTTGSTAFAGRISDAWADPSDDPALAGPEPVIRIEGGYFAYTPPPDAPAVSPLPAATGNGIVFGCFNDGVKINDALLASWASLLRRMPSARLLLKSRLFASSEFRQRVAKPLAADGVDPSRLELLPSSATRKEHLAMYGRVDIALDTFPYAGATTTCEALYMGVPVITLAGDRHASRLGVSILHALGHPEWIAPNREAYVEIAVGLSRSRERLTQLRHGLRDALGASPLCDGRRVAHAIETAARALIQARPDLG